MTLTITTVRHVALWFYFLTGLSAIVAIGWMARRRLVGLGVRLLGALPCILINEYTFIFVVTFATLTEFPAIANILQLRRSPCTVLYAK